MDASSAATVAAERRALAAERRVDEEVRLRLESIGTDRSEWPSVAREEAERLDRKLQVMHSF